MVKVNGRRRCAALLVGAALLGSTGCVTRLDFASGQPGPADATLVEDLAGFVAGRYLLIGRDPQGRAYVGTLRLERAEGALSALRCVAGERLDGRAHIDFATADRVPVLDIDYGGAGGLDGARFVIDGDLDNSALLSGPVRWRGAAGRGWEHAHADPAAADECG